MMQILSVNSTLLAMFSDKFLSSHIAALWSHF